MCMCIGNRTQIKWFHDSHDTINFKGFNKTSGFESIFVDVIISLWVGKVMEVICTHDVVSVTYKFGECRVVNTLWRLTWAICWNRVGRHIDTINDNREMLKESIWMIVKYSRCLWACVSDLRKITSTHEKPYYINGHLCMKLNRTMTRNKIKVKLKMTK